MIDQTRFFVTERDKIDTNIESGVINANDLVICSDTHELVYVNPDNTYFAITTTGDGMNELVQNLEDKLAEIREMAENSVVTGVKGSNELTYRKGNVNLGTDDFGLGNVTNHAQVRGLITGTTENHVLTWGPNGYIVKDSGYTIQSDVPENAVFTDTTYDVATTETDGLMSATDKVKLDNLENNESIRYGEATTTSAGLMSAADKIKLDGLENYVLNIQDADVPNTIARKTDLIPSPLFEDGDYTLKASVQNGEITYTWIKEAVANNLAGTAVVGTAIAG